MNLNSVGLRQHLQQRHQLSCHQAPAQCERLTVMPVHESKNPYEKTQINDGIGHIARKSKRKNPPQSFSIPSPQHSFEQAPLTPIRGSVPQAFNTTPTSVNHHSCISSPKRHNQKMTSFKGIGLSSERGCPESGRANTRGSAQPGSSRACPLGRPVTLASLRAADTVPLVYHEGEADEYRGYLATGAVLAHTARCRPTGTTCLGSLAGAQGRRLPGLSHTLGVSEALPNKIEDLEGQVGSCTWDATSGFATWRNRWTVGEAMS